MRKLSWRREEKLLLRITDANLNRVAEGLRVAEDVVRFVCNNAPVTGALRRLRHECRSLGTKFGVPQHLLTEARDSEKDVGRASHIASGGIAGACDVVVRNLKRAAEGLRVLEEMSKILKPRQSARFQQLRFKVYGLEKKVLKGF